MIVRLEKVSLLYEKKYIHLLSNLTQKINSNNLLILPLIASFFLLILAVFQVILHLV